MAGHIIVTDEESTRTIVMRRPEKKNALSEEMFLELRDAVATAQSNPEIRCLILTGRSGVFTAGDDVEDFLTLATGAYDPTKTRNSVLFLQALVNNRKPLIAAVDGIAVGMGATMVFHCDYVIAGTTASFSSPFVQYGLVPEGASSLLLPLMAGHQRAFAMLVMGRSISAEEGREAGFVNVVVPAGHTMNEAKKVAREICELPPDAVEVARKLLKLPKEDILRRIGQEEHLFGERMRAPGVVAALKSFLSRKKK
jgi:enoyl-CoA hydratase/carnithine racemase